MDIGISCAGRCPCQAVRVLVSVRPWASVCVWTRGCGHAALADGITALPGHPG